VTDSTSGKTHVPLLDDEDEVGGCGLAVATGVVTQTESSCTLSILLEVFEKRKADGCWRSVANRPGKRNTMRFPESNVIIKFIFVYGYALS
jgi:hypothetical protein